MGSCISKCSPKSRFKVEEEEDDQFCNHIQDKPVISTQPIKPTTPIPSHHSNKISPFPSSPSHSTSFSYSTTTTSTNSNFSSSTLSSSASSISTSSKIDRSFSNEFLRSCYNQNPHISRIASLKEAQKPITPVTSQQQKHNHHSKPNPINRGNAGPNNKTTTPQKRARTSTPSPTLKRQKSFSKEEPVITRSIRISPSPSRRFNQNNAADKRNRGSVVMGDPPKMGSNLKYPSGASGLKMRPCLKSQPVRETQTRIHRISSKIDEVAVREAMDHDHYMECVPEDIDNPLISLDCFIFL